MPVRHRHGNDYWEGGEDDRKRVLRALGPEPLPDARHRLPPVTLPPPLPEPPPGPRPAREFVVDLHGAVSGARIEAAFPPERRAALGFPALWGRPASRDLWIPVDEAHSDTRFSATALAWDLSALLSEGVETARELAGHLETAAAVAGGLGLSAAPRESPMEAAQRAERLLSLRERFGRSIELRLMPAGRPFPARGLWRAAYSLGMAWGDMDLFHWNDPTTGLRLFTMSGAGRPAYFLPERAEEGEGINGVALGFELPHSPAPVSVFDRVALAVAYLREQLGGRPATRDGRDLDGELLARMREDLEDRVADMAALGITPGSAEAARFF